jgi:hypothetical protein
MQKSTTFTTIFRLKKCYLFSLRYAKNVLSIPEFKKKTGLRRLTGVKKN